MSKYEKCMATIVPTLKKRGFDNHDELAANMCNMWADENGVEREFAVDGKSVTDTVSRKFALSLGEDTNMTFTSDDNGLDSLIF